MQLLIDQVGCLAVVMLLLTDATTAKSDSIQEGSAPLRYTPHVHAPYALKMLPLVIGMRTNSVLDCYDILCDRTRIQQLSIFRKC